MAKTASDSAYEYPWSPSRAVPEVEDLTGLIDWEEESEQQANERVKTEKAAKRKKKNKKKNDAKKKKGKRGAHQSQSTEAHGGDDDSKSGGPPTWGAHVAASMLVLVLKTMERHKNGRELNGIDLKKLRAAVAVTGGRSSTAGWDESFGCALTELTADNPHLAVRLISDVRLGALPHTLAHPCCVSLVPLTTCWPDRWARRGGSTASLTRCAADA